MKASAGKPVALMSGYAPFQFAKKALEMGTAGFVSKTLKPSSLVNAIVFMAAGEIEKAGRGEYRLSQLSDPLP